MSDTPNKNNVVIHLPEGIKPEDLREYMQRLFQVTWEQMRSFSSTPAVSQSPLSPTSEQAPETIISPSDLIPLPDTTPAIETMEDFSAEQGQLVYEHINSHLLSTIEYLFPGKKGLEFLSAILRHAEIKQNTLPGTKGMGTHVAVIQTRTIHILAKKIGWGYDTTHKYIVTFCALNLLFKRRQGGQTQLLFPFQYYTPPVDFSALNTLINQSRPKVRQFARNVKERAQLANILSSPDSSSSPKTDQLSFQHRLMNILREEGVQAKSRQHIALRIVTEVIGKTMTSTLSPQPAHKWPLLPQKDTCEEEDQYPPSPSHVSPPNRTVDHFPDVSSLAGSESYQEIPVPPQDTFTPAWEKSQEEIIQAAESNKRIPAFAREILKRGLARNAAYRQQDAMARPQKSTPLTPAVDLSTCLPVSSSPKPGHSMAHQYHTHADQVYSAEDQSLKSLPLPQETKTFYNTPQSYLPPTEDFSVIPDTQKEDYKKFEWQESTYHDVQVDLQPAESTITKTQKSTRKKAVKALPGRIESSQPYYTNIPTSITLPQNNPDILRNYVLSINNFIYYLYKNVTLRKAHTLEKFLVDIFDGGRKEAVKWHMDTVAKSNPQVLTIAFLEVLVALFAQHHESIQKPGSIFLSKCRLYLACEWHDLADKVHSYLPLLEYPYEQLIRFLTDHREMHVSLILEAAAQKMHDYVENRNPELLDYQW